LGAEVRMRFEHVLKGKKRLEAEAAEAIRLRSRISDIKGTDATRTSELESLKERNAALEFAGFELEATCSGPCDEVAGYKLFKEQVKRRILSRGLKLVIMKCLQSPGYLVVVGGALRRTIDKGMTDVLKAGVDHGRAERGLDVIVAYDPLAEANFVFAVDALRVISFPLLAQLESRKDASMADIMDLFRLEGTAADSPKASQQQPSFE
nr:hypothetical protein [Tanacetum cinerariifolium]